LVFALLVWVAFGAGWLCELASGRAAYELRDQSDGEREWVYVKKSNGEKD
jgi:hypothetical protein